MICNAVPFTNLSPSIETNESSWVKLTAPDMVLILAIPKLRIISKVCGLLNSAEDSCKTLFPALPLTNRIPAFFNAVAVPKFRLAFVIPSEFSEK